MSPASSIPHSRLRGGYWHGPAPIVTAVIAAIAMLGLWRLGIVPRFERSTRMFDPAVKRFVDLKGATDLIYVRGDDSEDALMVIGDSRVRAAISMRTLREHGVAPVCMLAGGLSQLDHALAVARTMRPRRLLISLTPASIYARSLPQTARELAEERAMSWRDRTDQRLDAELDTLRKRLVRPTSLTRWGSRGPEDWDQNRQTGIYRGILREETELERERHWWKLRSDLESLIDKGWKIACLRLPTSPSLRRLEERTIPTRRYRRLCRNLKIPLLDLSSEEVLTTDGSHVAPWEGERLSALIAKWLKEQDGMLPGQRNR